jgi:ATP-dependent exoDNAse (exonuclease V) beta subunit
VPIKHITINDKLITTMSDKEPIDKTETVQELLSKYFKSSPEKGRLSASALNDYIRCQKSFYYKYLENIFEPEQDESISISDTTLGTVAHAIMQDIYTPLEGKIVQKSDVQSLINNINNDAYWAAQTVLQKLQGDELAERVIRSSVINTLYFDYEKAPFEFIANEMKANRTIHLSSIGQDIAITGKVDRVDIQGQHMRVIDYKTGKVDLEYSDMKKVFGISSSSSPNEEPSIRNKGNRYILQTLLYCWLLENNKTILREQNKHGNSLLLAPHLFPMRQLHDTSTQTCVHYKQGETIDYDRLSNDFITELTNLLEEIFNPTIPFSPTENKDNCKDCYLAQICEVRGDEVMRL